MKLKNVKSQSAKVLAKVSLKVGKMSANSACAYIYHQPKMPDGLRELKKNKYEVFIGKINRLYC